MKKIKKTTIIEKNSATALDTEINKVLTQEIVHEISFNTAKYMDENNQDVILYIAILKTFEE